MSEKIHSPVLHVPTLDINNKVFSNIRVGLKIIHATVHLQYRLNALLNSHGKIVSLL